MSATNICFYSNKCQWSKAFITELSQTPWKSTFQFICVDPGPSRPTLPKWLKEVPTLVIGREPEPRTGAEVMNWLYEKKMLELKDTSAPKGLGLGGGPGPAVAENEPMGFNNTELSSFAKGFGYSGIDVDTSTQGNGGMSIPGAFSFLSGGAAEGDRQGQATGEAPKGAVSQRRSKKEEMFDKQMEQYQRDRESGMPKGPGRVGGGL